MSLMNPKPDPPQTLQPQTLTKWPAASALQNFGTYRGKWNGGLLRIKELRLEVWVQRCFRVYRVPELGLGALVLESSGKSCLGTQVLCAQRCRLNGFGLWAWGSGFKISGVGFK